MWCDVRYVVNSAEFKNHTRLNNMAFIGKIFEDGFVQKYHAFSSALFVALWCLCADGGGGGNKIIYFIIFFIPRVCMCPRYVGHPKNY